mgnify:CR=1 FL=1
MEKSDEIFKVSKDAARANDLFEMALERINIVIKSIPKSVPYKLLEEYYEVAVQLITSLMYAEGYKTLSHISLIEYLKKNNEFSDYELEMLDKMRKFRHGTVYYGRKESGNFFINHENEIKKLISKLVNLIRSKIKSQSS